MSAVVAINAKCSICDGTGQVVSHEQANWLDALFGKDSKRFKCCDTCWGSGRVEPGHFAARPAVRRAGA